MKQRQRDQTDVVGLKSPFGRDVIEQHPQVGAVGEHRALRPPGGAAGVELKRNVTRLLTHIGIFGRTAPFRIGYPAFVRSERDDRLQFAFDRRHDAGVDDCNRGLSVLDDGGKFVRRQPPVQRRQNGAC